MVRGFIVWLVADFGQGFLPVALSGIYIERDLIQQSTHMTLCERDSIQSTHAWDARYQKEHRQSWNPTPTTSVGITRILKSAEMLR